MVLSNRAFLRQWQAQFCIEPYFRLDSPSITGGPHDATYQLSGCESQVWTSTQVPIWLHRQPDLRSTTNDGWDETGVTGTFLLTSRFRLPGIPPTNKAWIQIQELVVNIKDQIFFRPIIDFPKGAMVAYLESRTESSVWDTLTPW